MFMLRKIQSLFIVLCGCSLLAESSQNKKLINPAVNHYAVCPPGWQRNEDYCYWFSHKTDTWYAARDECKKFGGFLAEPNNYEIDSYISGDSISKGVNYWIGLSDLRNEGQFMWEFSWKPLRYSNWVPGDPNNAHGVEDCVLTNWHKKWADAPCNWQKYYACQMKPTCAPGWLQKGRYCYWFSDFTQTWQGAKETCLGMGAILAEPKDRKSDKFISGDSIRKDIHYWIGLSDQQVEGQFIWESTSELARFTNWVPGDPNDAHGNEDCVLTNWHTKWADANCNWKEHFVCQGRI